MGGPGIKRVSRTGYQRRENAEVFQHLLTRPAEKHVIEKLLTVYIVWYIHVVYTGHVYTHTYTHYYVDKSKCNEA